MEEVWCMYNVTMKDNFLVFNNITCIQLNRVNKHGNLLKKKALNLSQIVNIFICFYYSSNYLSQSIHEMLLSSHLILTLSLPAVHQSLSTTCFDVYLDTLFSGSLVFGALLCASFNFFAKYFLLI